MKREPLYEQIKKYLYSEICGKSKDKDFALPSENEICARYGVSRITAKRALDELKQEGIIRRVKGKGSVLCENLPSYLLEDMQSNTPALRRAIASARVLTVILPDLTSKYYLDLINGIISCAADAGWSVQLECSNNSQEVESRIIKKVLTTSDGIIVSPVNYNIYNQEIIKLALKNFPMCLIDNNLNGLYLNFISSDSFNAVYQATEYFLKQGKNKIGYLTLPDRHNMALEERRRGYEQALIDHNVPIRRQFILSTSHNSIFDEDKMHEFFNNNPELDAVIAALCGLGLIAIKELLATNKPRLIDNMIVFDEDFPQMNDLLKVRIKYIRQNSIEIGRKAAEIVIRQFNDPKSNLRETIKIPAQLIL